MSSDLDLFVQLQSFLNGETSTLNEMPEQERFDYEPRSDTIAQGVFDPNPVVNKSTTVPTATVEDNNSNPNIQPTTKRNTSIGSELVDTNAEPQLDIEHGLDEAIQEAENIIDSEKNDDSLDIDDLFCDSLSAEIKLPQVDEQPKSTEVETEVNNSDHSMLKDPLEEGITSDSSRQSGRHKSGGVASNLEQDEGNNTEFYADLNAAFDTEFAFPVKSDVSPNFEDDLDAEMAAEIETELEVELEAELEAGFQQETENQTPQENGDIAKGSSDSSELSKHDQSFPVQTSSPKKKKSSARKNVGNPRNLGYDEIKPTVRHACPSNGPISGNSVLPNIRNRRPSRPGSSSKTKKSSKHRRRVSNFPWIYNKHMDFSKDVNSLHPSANLGQDTGLDEDEDEDEDDDESSGSVDEELNPQSQAASSKIVINLTDDDDDDEGVQDDALPSDSVQNVQPQEHITEMEPPELGYPSIANHEPLPASHNESPQPSIPQEILMPESQQPLAQSSSVENSTPPNHQNQSHKAGGANESGSSNSNMPDPGLNTQNNATKRKAQQLEPSESEEPMIEPQAKRPRNSPSTNEHPAPMNVNFHVHMGNQNINPHLNMQMGQPNVNLPLQMQMRQHDANVNMNVTVSQGQVQASAYMKYRMPELKQILKNRRIPRSGIKPILVQRLMEADIRRATRSQNQLSLANQQSQPQNCGGADNAQSLPEAHLDSAHMTRSSNNVQQNQGQQQYQPFDSNRVGNREAIPQMHSAHMMRNSNDSQHNQSQQQCQPLNSGWVGNDGSFPGFNPVQASRAVTVNLHHPQPRRMIPRSFNGAQVSAQMGLNNGTQLPINGGPVVATNHSNPNNGGLSNVNGQPYQTSMASSFDGSANRLSQQPFNSTGRGYDNSGYQQSMYSGVMGYTPYDLLPQQPQQPQYPQYPQQSQRAPHGTPSGSIQQNSNVNRPGNLSDADMSWTMTDMMGWIDEGSSEGR